MKKVRCICTVIAAISLSQPATCQQEKGNKEIGIGGQTLLTHSKDMIGNASFQFSFGYFASEKNYFGFEADPIITFQHTAGYPGVRVGNQVYGAIPAENNVSVGGFVGGNYRRLFGDPKGKVFPFFGGGGGAYVTGGSSGSTAMGTYYPEIGLKSYVSQKTSLEFSYKLLITATGGGTFRDKSISLATISIRHIF